MPREKAVREIVREVPADATEPLRIYVIAPSDTEAGDFAFSVIALDERGETDTSETYFEAPEDER
jgi:hypothetical protein